MTLMTQRERKQKRNSKTWRTKRRRKSPINNHSSKAKTKKANRIRIVKIKRQIKMRRMIVRMKIKMKQRRKLKIVRTHNKRQRKFNLLLINLLRHLLKMLNLTQNQRILICLYSIKSLVADSISLLISNLNTRRIRINLNLKRLTRLFMMLILSEIKKQLNLDTKICLR